MKKELALFHKDKSSKQGVASTCKTCRTKHYRDVYATDSATRKRLKETGSKWKRENKGMVNATQARRRAIKLSATPSWGDKEKVTRYYIIADFLTNKIGESHHVDHVIPLQGVNVCGLHVDTNLDVISELDNRKKSNKLFA